MLFQFPLEVVYRQFKVTKRKRKRFPRTGTSPEFRNNEIIVSKRQSALEPVEVVSNQTDDDPNFIIIIPGTCNNPPWKCCILGSVPALNNHDALFHI